MSLIQKIIALLDVDSKTRYHRELERWAKTEYSRDWQWAYNFMLENPGVTPTHRGDIS